MDSKASICYVCGDIFGNCFEQTVYVSLYSSDLSFNDLCANIALMVLMCRLTTPFIQFTFSLHHHISIIPLEYMHKASDTYC